MPYTITPDTLVETDEGARCTWAELLAANPDSRDDLEAAAADLRAHGRAVVGMCDVIRFVARGEG